MNTFIRQNSKENRQKDRHTHTAIYARQACTGWPQKVSHYQTIKKSH